jgi:PAS domain S-box-containing protein
MTHPAPVEPGAVYRRRCAPPGSETLDRFPVLAVLDQLPVPVLAIGSRGAILFCNNAFAEMIGYQKATVSGMNLREILLGLTLAEFVLPFLHARAGEPVNLIHARGWIFQARMSASAMRRDGDEVILSTFERLPPIRR